jgi:hypothetical protein
MNAPDTRRAALTARLALFAAALACPARQNYPTFAAYGQAFDAYQATTMAPLRATLAAAAQRVKETRP